MTRRPVLAFLAALAPILAVCSPSEPPGAASPSVTTEPTVDRTESSAAQDPEAPGDPATVTRVIDGDTIEVSLNGEVLRVRLIGVDTPETVDPSEPVGCYGPAASSFTTDRLEGQDVQLEYDVEHLDVYGRTLAYVWVGDELFNETLVARGFATVTTYPPNVKYVDRFTAAQADARSHERGLWGAVCNQPKPEPVNTGGGGGGTATRPTPTSASLRTHRIWTATTSRSASSR